MKRKWMMTTLLVLGLVACKEHHHGHGAEQKPEGSELRLNNGKKWQADSITRITYALLEKEAAAAKVSDRAAAAKSVERSEKLINGLIRGCTMTGDAHDQLHLLIGKTNMALNNLKNAEAGHYEHRLAELKTAVGLFPQYFE